MKSTNVISVNFPAQSVSDAEGRLKQRIYGSGQVVEFPSSPETTEPFPSAWFTIDHSTIRERDHFGDAMAYAAQAWATEMVLKDRMRRERELREQRALQAAYTEYLKQQEKKKSIWDFLKF